MQLVSLADVKSFLEKTDTTHDALITAIIEYYSQDFENRLNRLLKKQARTMRFDGGKRVYSLPAYPIDTAASITVKVDDVTRTKDDDYFVYDEEGLIEFRWSTPMTEPRNVEITWTGGYAEVSGVITVPDDLKNACKIQSAYLFRRRNDLGLTSISMPDGSVSVSNPADLLPEVKSVLSRYRRYYIS